MRKRTKYATAWIRSFEAVYAERLRQSFIDDLWHGRSRVICRFSDHGKIMAGAKNRRMLGRLKNLKTTPANERP